MGKLEGSGLVACVKAWKVNSPKVIVNHGAATDNNATQFAQGYFSVLTPLFKSGAWTDLEGAPPATLAGTWDPPTAETQFQQAFTANPTANATLTANDATAGAIITYLQQQGVKPYTFPTTGQDASLGGLQNIISGYQCGTVYKAVFLEAQAAAALAMYLRAGVHPAKTLINGSTLDSMANVQIPSVLETPKWVTASTIEKTVVHDKFVPASQICAGRAAFGPVLRSGLQEVRHQVDEHPAASYSVGPMTADSAAAAGQQTGPRPASADRGTDSGAGAPDPEVLLSLRGISKHFGPGYRAGPREPRRAGGTASPPSSETTAPASRR